ncbi:MAG: T9SS type A sorting domain-containing protein [bacterium]|nr:T9SS type A sorting domain-containing protein [bacterium]
MLSTSVRVRIRSTTNLAVGDTSNASMSIINPVVTVTAPNGGETLNIGSPYQIAWSNIGAIGAVRIHLNRNFPTQTWETIADSVVGTTFQWNVTGGVTSNARIRVTSIQHSVVDVSDANFTITAPTLTVLYPNGGEVFGAQSVTTRWSRQAAPGNVRVGLNRTYPSGNWELLGTSTTDSLQWFVSGVNTETARIRVQLVADTSVQDFSNNNFAIRISSVQSRGNTIPDKFSINSIYPNPFNREARIEIAIPKAGVVSLKLHDIMGRDVGVIFSGELQPGVYAFDWRNDNLSSGTYVLSMEAGTYVERRTIQYIR